MTKQSNWLSDFVYGSKDKVTNRSGIHRCSICNCVNTEAIETEIGDFAPYEYFTNDPKDPSQFICISCYEVIQDTLSEYPSEEDENGD